MPQWLSAGWCGKIAVVQSFLRIFQSEIIYFCATILLLKAKQYSLFANLLTF
jgi:hypothetical protein